MRPFFLITLAAAIAGQGRAALSDDALSTSARLVLRSHCFECHNGPGSPGGDADFLDRDQLVGDGYIDPEDPDASYLVDRIVDQSMPPLAQRQLSPVTDAELQVLRDWIASGAPQWPDESEMRGAMRTADALRLARDFLMAQDREERSAYRFFTLQVQHNDPSVTGSDLRLYQAALSKALNSLSWSREIILPIEIGATAGGHSSLMAVDLRLLVDARGKPWSQGDQWRRLSRAYPYGVSHVNLARSEEAELQAEVSRLVDPSGGELLPIIRADWFVATATRPPLYHKLLGIPGDESTLMDMLNVDPLSAAASPTPSRFARAGFTKSGVSGQNRLLERLTSQYGAYWRSYDFLPSTKRSNLRRFPLGPTELFAEGGHPHPDQVFEHDGGEVIFELPNGLHGYMLVDGRGARIDAGPIEVVHDRALVSGTPAIVTGVSCMWCHKAGMIDFVDEIRGSEAVFGDARAMVLRMYPRREDMERLVALDRRRFVAALEAAVGPFLLRGEDIARGVTDFQDPVGEVARRHRSHYMDADDVARELDLTDRAQLIEQLGRQSVRELALGPLLSGEGLIGRAEWEASDGRSLMQEVAAAMGLTPIQ